MSARTVLLEGIRNCRDLGGLTTTDGKTVRYRALLRSANLAHATPADLEKLTAQYRLSAVIDLRTKMERDQSPDRLPNGCADRWEPIFDEQAFGITHEKGEPERPPVELLDMTRNYRLMVTQGPCRLSLGRAVRAVMGSDPETGAVLWHCSEGKDRCGVVSALLLRALSVEPEQIMADYLLTNEVNEARADFYYHRALDEGSGEEFARAVRDAFLAKERYLETTFTAIRENYATFADFLTYGLQIPPETVAAFRAAYLV